MTDASKVGPPNNGAPSNQNNQKPDDIALLNPDPKPAPEPAEKKK